jgi:hypothetical protein
VHERMCMLPAYALADAPLPGTKQVGQQESRPQCTHKLSALLAHAGQEMTGTEPAAARYEGASGHTSTNSLSQAPWPPLLSTLITMGFGGTHCTRLQQRTQHQSMKQRGARSYLGALRVSVHAGGLVVHADDHGHGRNICTCLHSAAAKLSCTSLHKSWFKIVTPSMG